MKIKNKSIIIKDLGVVDYKECWDFQEELFKNVINVKIKNRREALSKPTSNYLLFVEHPHVYTLGKSGDMSNLLISETELIKKDAKFYKEGYSINYAKALTNKIWKLASYMKKDNFFINSIGGAITDDHYFVMMKDFKMPMIDIINMPSENFGFGSHWHTHGDNMEVIDIKTLEAVGQVVTAVVYKESNKEFL